MSKYAIQTNDVNRFLVTAVPRWLPLFCGYALSLAFCFAIIQGATGQSRNTELFKGPSVDLNHGRLKVSTNGRYLEHEDGTPFFWLGDTAWELFHRLNREESDMYLEDRRRKGFTVIQAVILADLEGLSVANAYGHTPLKNNDPATPDENYFKDVDYVVDRAQSLGMFIGMLPTWGDKFNKKWGFGPEIFTPDNAKQFGRFLGQRYRDKPIIWILGGDRIPETEKHYEIIRAMAEGLAEGDANSHLMTYHPWGETSSSQFFHNDQWLDFNMFQSGHVASDMPNYKYTLKDYDRIPVKPVVDGEPRYEDHPVKWDPKNGWFSDFDVRQAAYWSMLSGAAGHTYGDNNIWQMYDSNRAPLGHARTYWSKALQHPGAVEMGYMRQLFETRPFEKLRPAQPLLADNVKEDGSYQCAAIAADSSFVIVYSPYGKPVSLFDEHVDHIDIGKAYWFNPRTGTSTTAEFKRLVGKILYDPPGAETRGNDWVLVVDTKRTTLDALPN